MVSSVSDDCWNCTELMAPVPVFLFGKNYRLYELAVGEGTLASVTVELEPGSCFAPFI